MKHLLSTFIGIFFLLSSQAQTTNNPLLGTWQTIHLREIVSGHGEETVKEDDEYDYYSYRFASNGICYYRESFSRLDHPHNYRIDQNKVYLNVVPAHLKKIEEHNHNDDYDIDSNPKEYEFYIDPSTKNLVFIYTDEGSVIKIQRIYTLKKIK
ncbi:hypothetical protein [Sphingobacterium yanglingense]|uniref:Lipocalin-like protein n=1 Tax=Sphingobacterium yanglingense TaxID=1437280 RepID=A0A4R6WIV2_9SPHI|nr:hypothetical protein [Sphingobacterium yanglingense]TDQ77884.1 hypothetical protein CLV99_1853 [Sphingobacterium yanglingense]